jgi:hypothetical protein
MFDHHRKSPWFAEKYDPAPEMQVLRTRVRKEGWKSRIDTFLHDLASGAFDPDLNEPEPTIEPTSPVSPVKENAPSGQEAGSTTIKEDEVKPTNGDDEMQFTMETEEDTGDRDAIRQETNGKLSYDTRGNRGEEVSVAPEGNQVMIRTIPPDIGRVKLEEVNYSILASCHIADA